MHVTSFALTHSGLRRESNEDSVSARPNLGFWMVCDGMGGHAAGEVASRVAVDTIEAFIDTTDGVNDKNFTWPFGFDPSIGVGGTRLVTALRLANRAIDVRVTDDPALRGMATTAVALLLARDAGVGWDAEVGWSPKTSDPGFTAGVGWSPGSSPRLGSGPADPGVTSPKPLGVAGEGGFTTPKPIGRVEESEGGFTTPKPLGVAGEGGFTTPKPIGRVEEGEGGFTTPKPIGRVEEGEGGPEPRVLPALVAHVGDSRAYLWREGVLTRQTQDHSWVEEQVALGTLTEADARHHPWRNLVTRAISGGPDPRVDVTPLALEPGDRVLLCSDGLTTPVTDDVIASVLGKGARGDVEGICQSLIDAANAAGGPDNITVVVVEIL